MKELPACTHLILLQTVLMASPTVDFPKCRFGARKGNNPGSLARKYAYLIRSKQKKILLTLAHQRLGKSIGKD